MDVLHCGAGVLHCVEGLLVDVCGFDAVDFALERHNLRLRLFEGVLEYFLLSEGCLCRCERER